MSADNYLYVDRHRQRYAIVERDAARLGVHDSLRSGETIIADSTEPSSAVLMANKMQHKRRTQFGVRVSERVAKELGWR